MEPMNMSSQQRAELLLEVKWPAQLTDREMGKLAGFLLAYHAEAGESIFEEGEDAAYLGVVLAGEIEVRKQDESGNMRAIAILGPGDVFGEMALIDKHPRSARLHACNEARLLLLTVDNFERVLTELPRVAQMILKSIAMAMSLRLRQTNDQLVEALHYASRQG